MIINVTELRKTLEEIEDPRREHLKRYPLTDILLMAFIAIFCGYLGWRQMEIFCEEEEEWFKEKLNIRCGVPSHDTFRRVFMLIAPERLNRILTTWIAKVDREAGKEPRQICIDGKTIRGAKWKFSAKDVEMLNAYDVSARATVSSVLIDEGKGELSHVEELLDSLVLKGTLVSGDANFTTAKNIQMIGDRQAYFFLAVKGNRDTLWTAVRDLTEDPNSLAKVANWEERGSGQRKSCHLRIVRPSHWDAIEEDYPGIQWLVRLETTQGDCKETRYWVCSYPKLSIDLARKWIRGHWHIENELHRSLDVFLLEDSSPQHERTAAANLSIMRKLALTLLLGAPPDPVKKKDFDGPKMRILRASRSRPYRAFLLGLPV